MWDKLYQEALKVLNPKVVSPFIEAGGVSCALLTSSGNIYLGVCFDSACGLGMCAERNAIANMITHGESKIVKLVAIMSNKEVGLPCGSCRELLMQLAQENENLEILVSLDTKETILLKDLLPSWWGKSRY